LIYLDSNVFIYASLNRRELGEKARAIIEDIETGSIPGASSALTFDELVWAVKKQRSINEGLMAGEAFLNVRGLAILDVKHQTLSSALGFMRKYHLNPRDAIHLASASIAGAEFIVTEDEDLDVPEVIKRKPILNVATS
jgi:uncharacterized protein